MTFAHAPTRLRPLRHALLGLGFMLPLLAQAVTAPPSMADRIDEGSATTPAAAPSPSATELLWELDPYYSSLGLQIPLTRQPIPDGGQLPEAEVYRQLFRDSLQPRVLLLEASVYPLPIAGAWLKSHHPGTYAEFDIGELAGNRLNLLDGITAGFQEPWAVSAFVGSAMQFTRPGHAKAGTNRGYMGYLVSAGAKHIHNNVLIDDNWWELEWKLKGEWEFAQDELSWSFRVGAKNHGNPFIRDVLYVGLRRSNLDYGIKFLQFLRNTNIESLTELDRSSLRFLRQELTFGRKFPLARWHVAFALDLGLIYEDEAKYSGPLSDPSADSLTIVFRPNIQF